MLWTVIRDNITIRYPQFEMTGCIEHDPAQHALAHIEPLSGDVEVLSIDLLAYGHVPEPGQCFIKDWSEHAGFTAALVAAGVVDVIAEVNVGPFAAHAYRVRVI